MQIATALKYVPRKNVYILLFEDFIQITEQETKKLLEFMGPEGMYDGLLVKEN